MKTLIVDYTPRGSDSNTRKVLDAFVEAAPAGELEKLDLAKNLPDLFSPERLQAYIGKYFMGQALTPAQQAALQKMDQMTAQLKRADAVVLAFPMHNFSMPAVVKAWFDSVMQKGETWDMDSSGYVGLLKGRKALIILSSGGVYEGAMQGWEHAASLAKAELQFMGFGDVRVVTAAGVNAKPDQAGAIIQAAQEQARAVAREWYGRK